MSLLETARQRRRAALLTLGDRTPRARLVLTLRPVLRDTLSLKRHVAPRRMTSRQVFDGLPPAFAPWSKDMSQAA